MVAAPFRESEWFDPLPGGRYPARMPGMIHGVYAIRDAKSHAVLYVGESHTARLRDTMRRHLARWIDAGKQRESYRRSAVQVAWREVPQAEVLDAEAALIAHYAPQDNTKGLEPDEWGTGPAQASPGAPQGTPDWAEEPAYFGSDWPDDADAGAAAPADEIPF